MDFSYLDKESYKSIPLLVKSDMSESSGKEGFFIRKCEVSSESKGLHRHTYIQINYVYDGNGYHVVNDKKTEIRKGDIFIIPPFVPHVIISSPDSRLEIFEFEFCADFILPNFDSNEKTESYLDFAYLEPFMVAEEKMKLCFNLGGKIQSEVESILWEVYREYESKIPGYILIAKALLLKLLVITGRAFSNEIKGTETEKVLNKHKATVLSSLKYIEENYKNALTLDKIATSVGYSKSHFCYLFKAVIGRTYIEYLNEVRVSEAKRLLIETSRSIMDISLEVGFNSITNFNKTFKQITGVSPGKFRNK